MRSIKLGDHLINDDSLPFFIAEVGSNHQGSTEMCKELILAAKEAGASAVKLQKRENKTFYSKDLYNEPYNNPDLVQRYAYGKCSLMIIGYRS